MRKSERFTPLGLVLMALMGLALLTLLFNIFVPIAYGQTPEPVNDVVSVPWGDWLASALGGIGETIGGLLNVLIFALLAMVPKWIQELVRPLVLTSRVDQVFAKAAKTAIAGVRGSVAGKTLDIEISNALVRETVKLVIERAAPTVVAFAGSSARALAEKALSRLQEAGAVFPEDYDLPQAEKAAIEPIAAAGQIKGM